MDEVGRHRALPGPSCFASAGLPSRFRDPVPVPQGRQCSCSIPLLGIPLCLPAHLEAFPPQGATCLRLLSLSRTDAARMQSCRSRLPSCLAWIKPERTVQREQGRRCRAKPALRDTTRQHAGASDARTSVHKETGESELTGLEGERRAAQSAALAGPGSQWQHPTDALPGPGPCRAAGTRGPRPAPWLPAPIQPS